MQEDDLVLKAFAFIFQVYEEGDWLGLNAGGFLVRNSHRGRAFVDAVMEYGALDKRVEVGKMLSREIQGRVQGEKQGPRR